MAQNITLMGASYSDVPAVQLPKTGGGTALFSDPSITTALASDVASGKTFLLADGSIGTGTASGGGGGASNVVTGTFKGTTTGAAMDVTIPYTGNGYPIAITIYPTEGPYNSGTGSFYNLIQRYAIANYHAVKDIMNQAPTYEGGSADENRYNMIRIYKSSASSATTYSSTGSFGSSGNVLCAQTDATSSITVKFKSKNAMSVFIASTSYGFAANIEYTYHIIYSS